jgi:P-type Cu+ transporter
MNNTNIVAAKMMMTTTTTTTTTNHAKKDDGSTSPTDSTNIMTIHLRVGGMMCQRNCGSTVAKALESCIQDDDVDFDSSHDNNNAVVESRAIFAEERAVLKVNLEKLSPTFLQPFATNSTTMSGSSNVENKIDEALLRQTLEQAAVDAVEMVGFEAAVIPDFDSHLCQKNQGAQKDSAPSKTTPTTPTTVYLKVTGMMCQRNCGTTVENALKAIPGVSRAEASFEHGRAQVVFDIIDASTRTTAATMTTSLLEDMQRAAVNAVEAVGFDAEILYDANMYAAASQKTMKEQSWHESALSSSSSMEDDITESFAKNASTTIMLSVKGMSCAVCTGRVERALQSVSGVVRANVVLATNRAAVEYRSNDDDDDDDDQYHDPLDSSQESNNSRSGLILISEKDDDLSPGNNRAGSRTGLLMDHDDNDDDAENPKHVFKSIRDQVAERCRLAVQQAGYECEIMQLNNNGKSSLGLRENAQHLEQSRLEELNSWKRLLATSIVLLVPMILLQRGVFSSLLDTSPGVYPTPTMYLLLLLSTTIQFTVGRRFYKAAYRGLQPPNYAIGMDFLIVLGTTASYVCSVVLFLIQLCMQQATAMQPSFLTNAMLLTFVSLGKFLESFARGQTATSLTKLMELQPLFASRIVITTTIDDDNNKNNEDWLGNIAALETQEVSAMDIQVGDFLRVLPGGRVPADGMLVAISSSSASKTSSSAAFSSSVSSAARAYLDEAALSGEPFPVPKVVGDKVYGSTINQLSVLVIRVTAAGSDTVLSKIVQLVEDAQTQKAPIQAYADRVAGIFAPIVICLALTTFLAWFTFNHDVTLEERFFAAFMSSISVIVVACPCALGLATPTAVMVGTGVGATLGLLIKGGHVLENMQAVQAIVFDKTGTLTSGKAVLAQRHEFINTSKDGMMTDPLLQNLPARIHHDKAALWLAACAEAQSEHPLAQAIVNAARQIWTVDMTCSQDGVIIDDFQVVPGSGVECTVQRQGWGSWIVRIGTAAWARAPVVDGNGNDDSSLKSTSDTTGDEEAARLRHEGKITVYLSVFQQNAPTIPAEKRRRVIGVFGIADQIKPEARSTVAALQKQGMDVWMCTGDHAVTALAVAQHVGISPENVCSSVTPQGKADLVTRLQKSFSASNGTKGKRVAMVADGVNDAVALARADVGIAIGAGTEVAVEAADLVLVRSNLHDVVVAYHLSSVTFRRIMLNFFWAMCYNLCALPFAAGVLYPFIDFRLPPEVAGLMMAMSSVSVVTSSLLLRLYRRPTILADGTMEGKSGPLPFIGAFLDRMKLSTTARPMMRPSRKGYDCVQTTTPVSMNEELRIPSTDHLELV